MGRVAIKFELPEIKNKAVKPTTRTIYKRHLNKLTSQGYVNIEELQNQDKDVVNFIKETIKEVKEQKMMLFSIFYALADTEYIKSPNPYYLFFQDLKSPEQKKWEETEKPKWLEEKAKASKESPLGVPLAS